MKKLAMNAGLLLFYLIQFTSANAGDNHFPWGKNGIQIASDFEYAYNLGLLPQSDYRDIFYSSDYPTFYLPMSTGETMVVQKGKNENLETCIAVQIVNLDGSKRWAPKPKLIPLEFSVLNSVISDGEGGFYISAYCRIADTSINGILFQHFNRNLEPTFGQNGYFFEVSSSLSEQSVNYEIYPRKDGRFFLFFEEKTDDNYKSYLQIIDSNGRRKDNWHEKGFLISGKSYIKSCDDGSLWIISSGIDEQRRSIYFFNRFNSEGKPLFRESHPIENYYVDGLRIYNNSPNFASTHDGGLTLLDLVDLYNDFRIIGQYISPDGQIRWKSQFQIIDDSFELFLKSNISSDNENSCFLAGQEGVSYGSINNYIVAKINLSNRPRIEWKCPIIAFDHSLNIDLTQKNISPALSGILCKNNLYYCFLDRVWKIGLDGKHIWHKDGKQITPENSDQRLNFKSIEVDSSGYIHLKSEVDKQIVLITLDKNGNSVFQSSVNPIVSNTECNVEAITVFEDTIQIMQMTDSLWQQRVTSDGQVVFSGLGNFVMKPERMDGYSFNLNLWAGYGGWVIEPSIFKQWFPNPFSAISPPQPDTIETDQNVRYYNRRAELIPDSSLVLHSMFTQNKKMQFNRDIFNMVNIENKLLRVFSDDKGGFYLKTGYYPMCNLVYHNLRYLDCSGNLSQSKICTDFHERSEIYPSYKFPVFLRGGNKTNWAMSIYADSVYHAHRIDHISQDFSDTDFVLPLRYDKAKEINFIKIQKEVFLLL